MLTGVGVFIILILVAYLVLMPLVSKKPVDKYEVLQELNDETSETALEKNKEAVLTTINEIEFDYNMKKLSEDDYQQLKNQYRHKALQILHEEDEATFAEADVSLEGNPEEISALEEEINKELQAIRKTRETPSGTGGEPNEVAP